MSQKTLKTKVLTGTSPLSSLLKRPLYTDFSTAITIGKYNKTKVLTGTSPLSFPLFSNVLYTLTSLEQIQ